MKASELRIGNYIGCKVSNDAGTYRVWGIDGWQRVFDKKDTIVKGVNMGKSYNDYRLVKIFGGARDNEIYPECNIKAIPLTEEWLTKLGFENNCSEFIFGDFKINLFNRMAYVCGNEITNIDILHVHQLQNLYFALTGEDLTII